MRCMSGSRNFKARSTRSSFGVRATLSHSDTRSSVARDSVVINCEGFSSDARRRGLRGDISSASVEIPPERVRGSTGTGGAGVPLICSARRDGILGSPDAASSERSFAFSSPTVKLTTRSGLWFVAEITSFDPRCVSWPVNIWQTSNSASGRLGFAIPGMRSPRRQRSCHRAIGSPRDVKR